MTSLSIAQPFEVAKSIRGTAIVLALCCLPLLTDSGFYLHIAVFICINAILTQGLFLVFRTGQLSLCHAAFAGLGAYASAISSQTMGLPPLLGIVMAAFLAGMIAIVIGFISLPLRGAYFVLVTFLFGQLFNLIVLQATDLTNGANGISGIAQVSFLGNALSTASSFYIFALLIAVATYLVIQTILKGATGIALAAIEENVHLAESAGIPTRRYQILAFAVGSTFAGIAGALYAHYVRFVSPDSFTFWDSVTVVVMLIIGGRRSHFGAIIGAAVLTPLPEALRAAEAFQNLLYGALLVAVLRFLPNGITTLGERVRSRPKEQRTS